jgi:hypothetical protein
MDLFFPLNDPFSLDITSYSEKWKNKITDICLHVPDNLIVLDANILKPLA